MGFFMLFELVELTGSFDPRISCRGLCESCGQTHGMAVGYAAVEAKKLMDQLTAEQRIDFVTPRSEADPRFSTDYLWGVARGQMFGVMVCRDQQGNAGVIKAFSGQYDGVWNVPGWVPPLVDAPTLARVSSGVEKYIKKLGKQIDEMPETDPGKAALKGKRKALSQALMKDIHAMYRIPNFRGEIKGLPDIVTGDRGIPTGTADCCAPKLLGYAARHSLSPLGIVEFYFGKENRSGTKKHGGMYTSCKEKCGRILGYMLCGAGKK